MEKIPSPEFILLVLLSKTLGILSWAIEQCVKAEQQSTKFSKAEVKENSDSCTANNYGRTKHRKTCKLKIRCHYLSGLHFCMFTKWKWTSLYWEKSARRLPQSMKKQLIIRSNSPHFQQVKTLKGAHTSNCFPVFATLAVELVVWQKREVHKALKHCYNAVMEKTYNIIAWCYEDPTQPPTL